MADFIETDKTKAMSLKAIENSGLAKLQRFFKIVILNIDISSS